MNYAEIRKHPPDFEVRYRFLSAEEGGRVSGPPWQHYRCDWAYEGDDPMRDGIFMIHPEFIDEQGLVRPERVPVPVSGLAAMWILIPEMRAKVHCIRIAEGVHGYFMEGSRRVAEAVVTRVLGLHSNPTLTVKHHS